MAGHSNDQSLPNSKQHAEIQKLAIFGCGSMGGGMALLFAENDCEVFLRDPSHEAMDKVINQAEQDGIGDKIQKFDDNKSMCKAFGNDRRVFLWSLPHGHVGDNVLESLMPFLRKDDIILDAANEHWENTERRIGKAVPKGIRYVGMGVSGGYQAARRGPSICPGTDDETFDIVLPLLRKVAAKAPDGSPCVGRIGSGGAGHYCKMIHNGIEHGMMSAICEAWAIMKTGLEMNEDEIGHEFRRWNNAGEFKGTFLVRIAADICLTKNEKGERVVDLIEDKVVQDVCGEEGTGVWSNQEAIGQHVPGPTLTAAHYLRLASADLHQRRIVNKEFSPTHQPQKINVEDKQEFLENLRLATFSACLSAYVQGMNVIDKADKEKHFNVNYQELLQIWRAGCIIQADYISEALLIPYYENYATTEDKNPLFVPTVAKDLKKTFQPLKAVVLKAIEADHVIPALSSSLDYLKYMTSTALPTAFQEAQLDYFGRHMYDTKGDDPTGLPNIGKHHFEWRPA